VDDGLIPAKQLSTDDFAGTLANQTNLALKAIVGIGAMAQIACKSGYPEEGSAFRTIAENYVQKWIRFSLSDSGNHTKLAYQLKDSWGTLYNLFGVGCFFPLFLFLSETYLSEDFQDSDFCWLSTRIAS
jgi:hypothetical protein